MQQCQICGRQCEDNVKFCPSCGNSNFTRITEDGQQELDDMGKVVQDSNQSQPGYSYSYNQNHAYSQPQPDNGTKMTKSQFYKRCVPSDLKGQMTSGYAILILNLVVFAGLAFWYEEPVRLLDCGVLAVILLGLVFTKSLIFAIVDAAYFTVACILSMMKDQRATGILAIIVAFSLLPATYKIGKLWRRYKKTGEYVDYSGAVPNAGKKSRTAAIVIGIVSVMAVVAICAGLIFFQDGGFSSFERGSWEGKHYENESLKLAVDLPDGSWVISDEDELEELNDEARSEAGFAKTEEFDCMVQNLATGSNFMILHLKGSFSEEEAVEEIKTNLTESYRQQYGVPTITNAGRKKLGGETYTCLDIRISIYGASMYQRIYVRKVGREICEVGFTGLDRGAISEMEQFCSELN